jgi:single-strand DNA-binding protein
MAQVIGRITKDAEVKTSKNGKEFVAFTVAENFDYKNKDGERIKNASFISCAYWRSTKVAPHLTKGTSVVIYGQLSARPFSDHEGNNKASVNMSVSDLDFNGGRTKEKAAKPAAQPETAAEPTGDLPF